MNHTQQALLEAAFINGFQAARDGHSANPYGQFGSQSRAWYHGHEKANKAIARGAVAPNFAAARGDAHKAKCLA